MLFVRSLLLGFRTEGLRATAGRIWTRLFGDEEYFVFVRRLEPPPVPVELPVEGGGMTVRGMIEEDLDQVARLLPFSLSRMPFAERRAQLARCLGDSVVAVIGDAIVGAVWYLDEVGPRHPWYETARSQIEPPARITSGAFVLPKEKLNAWFLTHTASSWLASKGVRTTISTVRSDNKPSLLMARIHGGKLAAKCSVSYRFGLRTTRVEAVSGDEPLLKRS